MLLLALDTSTPTISVAIGDGSSTLGGIELGPGRRHAEQLAPAIAYLSRESGTPLASLTAVAVGLGPGLFTGLRVGVTTARVLAQTLRIPVVGVPSLDLLAWSLRWASTQLVVPVTDARRREVFYALYRPVPGGVQRVSEYEAGPPADLAAELTARGEDVLLTGDGPSAYPEQFQGLERVELAGRGFGVPSAAVLLELAAARVEREEFVTPSDITPLYLRASDAEIDWNRVSLARAAGP